MRVSREGSATTGVLPIPDGQRVVLERSVDGPAMLGVADVRAVPRSACGTTAAGALVGVPCAHAASGRGCRPGPGRSQPAPRSPLLDGRAGRPV
ncbi:MAG: hypothetical protein ACK52I_28180 [Pseudomonadota bacterium]